MSRPRLAAIAILLSGAAFTGAVLLRTDWSRALATSPLELIPAADHSQELDAVRQLAGDAQARAMLALVDSPSGRAKEAAGALCAALEADTATPGMAAVNPHDMGSRRETGRLLFENRFALLFPAWLARAEAELKATGTAPTPEALAGLAVRRLDAFLKTDAAFAFEKLMPQDPLPLIADATLPLMKEAGPPPQAGRAMVWVDTRRAPLAKAGQQPVFDAMTRAEAAMKTAVPDATLKTTGVNAFAAASERGIKGELSLLNGVSLAGVALVCMLALRSVLILPHVAVLTLLAMGFSWSVALLAYDRIHVFAVALGALLSGICVDFALYVMLHDGSDGRPASFDRLRPILRPLCAGGLVAAAGFAFLTFSSLPAIRQTGVFTATGIAAALVFSVAWGSLFRFRHAGDADARPAAPGSRRFAPRAWWLLPLIAGVPFVHWQDSLRELEYPLPELRARDREIRESFGESGRRMWLVSGDSCGEAVTHLREFAAHTAAATGGRDAVRGPLTLLCTPAEHAAADRFLREHGSAFATAYRAALTRDDYDPADFAPFFAAWDKACAGLPAYEATTDGFLAALTGPESMLVSRNGPLRLLVCWTDARLAPAEPPAGMRAFPVNRLESLNATLAHYRDNMLTLVLTGFACTVLVNLAILRRLGAVRDFTLPVGVTLAAVGLAGWCGCPLTLFHLAGAFLGLCCALNYPVFAREAHLAGKAFPKAVTLAWATTALSFGALMASSIPAVFALGMTVTTLVTGTYLMVRFDRRWA